MKVHNWPVLDEHQYYIRDKQGIIWFVDGQYGSGIATAVTSKGAISVGLSVLRDLRGPLHLLEFLNQNNGILDQVPTIDPKQNLNEAKQEIVATTEAEARGLTNG